MGWSIPTCLVDDWTSFVKYVNCRVKRGEGKEREEERNRMIFGRKGEDECLLWAAERIEGKVPLLCLWLPLTCSYFQCLLKEQGLQNDSLSQGLCREAGGVGQGSSK